MVDNIYIFNMWGGSKSQSIFNVIVYGWRLWRTSLCLLSYMLSTKQKRQLIMSDVGTCANLVRMLIFFKYYRTLFYHRLGKKSVFISWLLPGDKTVIVPFSTPIGKSANFIHNYGSHLNAKSIGDNFRCYQYVVMGNKFFRDKGRPTIGNNVTCATGVVIVGDITIGDNVQIAANAFVNRSIPDNCVVMGNPARIVKRDGISIECKN